MWVQNMQEIIPGTQCAEWSNCVIRYAQTGLPNIEDYRSQCKYMLVKQCAHMAKVKVLLVPGGVLVTKPFITV